MAPPQKLPTRKTLEMGSRTWAITTTVQQPTELRSLLLPVGWTLVALYVGERHIGASPATAETALEESERREARAHYVRWRLDAPITVHVGQQIRTEVTMPMMYAEALQ
jgi:hypothetical protein